MKAKPKTKTKDAGKALVKPQGKAAKAPSQKKKAKAAAEAKTTGKAKKSAVRKDTKQSELFVRGLLVRGEAVPPRTPGKRLPPGATHVVVEDEKGGGHKVKRVRFSMG